MLLPGLPLVLLSKQGFAIRRILAKPPPPKVFSVFFFAVIPRGVMIPAKGGHSSGLRAKARAQARALFSSYTSILSVQISPCPARRYEAL